MQSNELNFKGQNIWIGIDVHLKSWNVSILTDKLHHKTFSQPLSVEVLSGYLHRNFPDGSYHSVYERLAGYIGLVPTSHSSGEKDNKGEMTFRGRMKLRNKIIESAWIAARIDSALSITFYGLTKRMQPNKAIIRIARKLLNRVFYVLKYKRKYECAIVK